MQAELWKAASIELLLISCDVFTIVITEADKPPPVIKPLSPFKRQQQFQKASKLYLALSPDIFTLSSFSKLPKAINQPTPQQLEFPTLQQPKSPTLQQPESLTLQIKPLQSNKDTSQLVGQTAIGEVPQLQERAFRVTRSGRVSKPAIRL